MIKRRPSFFSIVALFVFGFVGTKTYQFVGTMRVGETLALVCLPFLITNRKFTALLKEPPVKYSVLTMVFWTLCQLASDAYNRTDFTDVFKGNANLAFATTTFLFLAFMLRNNIRGVIVLFLAGSVGGLVFQDLVQTSDEILNNEYWDLRVGYWAAGLVMGTSLMFVNKFRTPVAVMLLVYGLTAVTFGGRSHGLTFLCAASALIFSSPNMRRRFAQTTRRQTTNTIIGVSLAMCVAFPIYVHYGLKGQITKKAKQQLESAKNPYNPYEILMEGRYGLQHGTNAILRRPLAGYGSRAYSGDYLPASATWGRTSRSEENMIHSILFESWAFGGIGCGFACLLLLVICLKRCLQLLDVNDYRCILIVSYVAASMIWLFLASPLPALRLGWPTLMALTMVFSDPRKN